MDEAQVVYWDEGDSLRSLRQAFHNTVDWAVFHRLPEVEELHKEVYHAMHMTAMSPKKRKSTPKSSLQKSNAATKRKSSTGSAPQLHDA